MENWSSKRQSNSDKGIPNNSGTKECESPSLFRRKKKGQKIKAKSKSMLISLLLWGWFRSEKPSNRKIEDKYESILYYDPKRDTDEQNASPQRKSNVSKVLSSLKGNVDNGNFLCLNNEEKSYIMSSSQKMVENSMKNVNNSNAVSLIRKLSSIEVDK